MNELDTSVIDIISLSEIKSDVIDCKNRLTREMQLSTTRSFEIAAGVDCEEVTGQILGMYARCDTDEDLGYMVRGFIDHHLRQYAIKNPKSSALASLCV